MAFGSTLSLNDTFRRPTAADVPTPVAPTPIDATPVAPTVAAPVASNFDQYSQLSQVQEQRLQNYLSALAAGETLKPNQLARVEKFGALTGQDFLAPYAPAVTPTAPAAAVTPQEPVVAEPVAQETPTARSYYEATGMLPTTSAYGYNLFEELGRGQEKKLEKLVNLLASGQELTPQQIQKLTRFGELTGYDFLNVPTYADIEKELGAQAGGMTFQDVVDYVTQNVEDPTKIYQRATELGLSPEEILTAFSATGKRGRSPYSLEEIQGFFESGKAGYGESFENILASTFGAENVESAMQFFKPEDFAGKSLETIQETLQNSTQNKTQDALTLANFIGAVYGYDQNQALRFATDLVEGKVQDEGIMSVYNDLLKSNSFNRDTQNDLMQHIAQTNPDAYIFKQNPQLLDFYTPIEEITGGNNVVGQYGYHNNAPILSADEADAILNGEVSKANVFGYGGDGRIDNNLGWDLHSKYAGSIRNGAGIFGVNATQDEINTFADIQKQIDALGGIQTQTDSEGNTQQGVYTTQTNADGTPVRVFVPVEQLFTTYSDPESGANNGAANYQTYTQTMAALERGAKDLGLDASQFDNVADLFEAVNDGSSHLYVVTGRSNNWDEDIAEIEGITGVGRKRGGINHATVLYEKVGDKLVPVDILKTFNFDDPETSKGFVGDFIGNIGQIMSLPPIQAAFFMAGGINGLLTGTFGQAPTVVAAATGELATTLGEDLLVNLGMESTSQIASFAPIVGGTVLAAANAGIMTALSGGDWEDVLTAAASGGLGTGIAGLTGHALRTLDGINLSNKQISTISNIVGGAAATAATGQSVEDYIKNRVVGSGLEWLVDNGLSVATDAASLSGDDKRIFKALMPIIMSKRFGAADIVNIAQALDKTGYFKTA